MISSFLKLLLIVVARGGNVHLGTPTGIQGPAPLAVAVAPTGSRFVASFDDNTVRIIDAATRATIRVLKGHPQPAYAVAWSADGRLIASGDESARIIVWNASTGDPIKTFRTHIRGIENLSFNRDHSLLLSTGKDDLIKIYDLKKWKEIRSLPGDGANFFGAHFSPLSNVFVAGVLTTGAREYTAMGGIARLFTGHNGQGVLDLDISPNGQRVVTGGKDSKAIVWDMRNGTKLGTLFGHEDWVLHTAYAPDGVHIATSSDDRSVRIWDTHSMKMVAMIGSESAVGAPIRFTSDGRYLISSSVSDELQVTPITPPFRQEPVKPVRKHRVRHSLHRHR